MVIRIASDEFEAEAKRQKLLDAYAEELDADNVKFVFGFGSSIAIEDEVFARAIEYVQDFANRREGRTWLRGQDLNLRPSGYEPDELPGCSTPRHQRKPRCGLSRVASRVSACVIRANCFSNLSRVRWAPFGAHLFSRRLYFRVSKKEAYQKRQRPLW